MIQRGFSWTALVRRSPAGITRLMVRVCDDMVYAFVLETSGSVELWDASWAKRERVDS